RGHTRAGAGVQRDAPERLAGGGVRDGEREAGAVGLALELRLDPGERTVAIDTLPLGGAGHVGGRPPAQDDVAAGEVGLGVGDRRQAARCSSAWACSSSSTRRISASTARRLTPNIDAVTRTRMMPATAAITMRYGSVTGLACPSPSPAKHLQG